MRLKELVDKSGKMQKDIAAELGISQSTFNTYVKEKRKMPYPVLLKISQYFNVSVEYMLGVAPSEPDISDPELPVMMLPVYGMIRAGQPVLMEEDIEEWLPYPKRGKPEDWLCLRVEGDSMNAAGIQPGCIAVFHRQPTVENGMIAAVAVDDEATIKTFYQEDDYVVLYPNSSNLEHKIQRYSLKEHSIRVLGQLDSIIIRFGDHA